MREELGQRLFLRWPMWFDVQGFEHTNDWLDILWRLFADWLRWALEGGNTPLFVRTVAEAALMACMPDYELLRPVLLELKRRHS
jgi:hypothetical protein